ncbi:sigma-70 family RNA polymerase sigma factor [Candidatus Synchoanobacter obligatus]|uniref:Sigma-70 family RNA polymerase sigma factor n=1 Tax=Candidatus Synchoanobacter obligatus TaxID=2919597 RepID=A0ABT1L562_9GAMM|nr:sigma-70 family RNA polymerase sigma factor [Candidatus Synchoanobacter obligatus]MCP8352319.1 sigma-70 family RNA polymerase sigma factor [Candidatus Synchoanobacter obligatus]
MAHNMNPGSQESLGYMFDQAEDRNHDHALDIALVTEFQKHLGDSTQDRQAREMVFQRMLPLHAARIHAHVKRHSGKHLSEKDIEEMRQEASIALMHAMGKYDAEHEKGAKFTTYAWPWIKQAVDRYIRKSVGSVKLPDRRYYDVAKALHMMNNGYTFEETAEALGVKESLLISMLESRRDKLSLDGQLVDDSEMSLGEVVSSEHDLSPEANAISEEEKIFLRELADQLDDGQEKIIQLRYDQDRTYDDIAKIVAASRGQVVNKEGVRQEELKALEKLRYLYRRKEADRRGKVHDNVSSVSMFTNQKPVEKSPESGNQQDPFESGPGIQV